MGETTALRHPKLEEIVISGMAQQSYHQKAARYYYLKRFMDLSLVSAMMLLLAPLMLIIAVLIKLDSPGPVFFVQERIGSQRQSENGRTVWKIRKFRIYKFRSMFQNADESLHRAYIKAFVQGSIEKSDSSRAKFKLTNDPRVTRVGSILRKTSLDELPQLFNVLLGQMSLVGPHPATNYEVAEYQEPWHYGRLATLPGITGLWQVKSRSQGKFEEMIRLDLEYIHQQSLWLDIKILLQTIPAIVYSSGAE
jgi:lipopolysaccharide/colanic/teichoic acid biosynthesis glycosyltransferase